MTKKKEKEEDIIKKKNSHREEEIELEDIENLEEEVSPVKSSQDEVAKREFNGVNKKEEASVSAGEYLDNWKRAVADFENYKKQQAQSQKEFAKFANMNLIMQILPVLDNFHASTEHIPEDQKNNPWVTGIMYIQKQLEQVLKDNGVEEIEVKEGDEFSPHFHEAITNNQETITKEKGNKILKVIQRGYKIDGKVIRAARVVVG